MQTQTKPSSIRWMTAKDIPQVSSLARENAVDFKITDKDLMSFSKSRNHIPKVMASGSFIIGFTLYVVQQRSIDVLAVCIRKKKQRQGLGRKLLEELAATANKLGKDSLSCHVPENNLTAQLFFKSLGFRWVATVNTVPSAMPLWAGSGGLYKMQYVEEDVDREPGK